MTVQQDVELGSRVAVNDESLEKSSDESILPEHKAPPVSPWHPSQYPDGGFKAWTVTAAAFSCVFCSFGWINCESPPQVHRKEPNPNKTQASASSKTITSPTN
ncbi:hypothetical protein BDV29DRAFT_62798 [Aspergillus leporis]|uniref:Uncharacterized protein n=1 Tax=Aspergillus leporis TaxID=41062 RepID=A0A5N5WKN7_9EURO|nr:hypothetical protein BDV29DRAFT_62798 [Aspergillus leporis]